MEGCCKLLCRICVGWLVIAQAPLGQAQPLASTPPDVAILDGSEPAASIPQATQPILESDTDFPVDAVPSPPAAGVAGAAPTLTLDTAAVNPWQASLKIQHRAGAELTGIMQECAIFMGNQKPAEVSEEPEDEEIEATGRNQCRKQRGQLPIVWQPGRQGSARERVKDTDCYTSYQDIDVEEPVETTLLSCVASCTVARQCNFITFTPLSENSQQGSCTSFHINADCFSVNDDPRCYAMTEGRQTVGFSLGDCPFAAEPSGDIISRSFGLFRAMRQDAANGLAIAASALTIMVAVAGAPFSFLSKVFKL